MSRDIRLIRIRMQLSGRGYHKPRYDQYEAGSYVVTMSRDGVAMNCDEFALSRNI